MLGRIRWGRLRERLWTMAPFAVIALTVGATFWLAAQFVAPAPPKTMTIATASKNSPYTKAALRYQAILAARGIDLKIVETKGSFENLALITAPNTKIDAAFIQGGLANINDAPNLRSLGQVFYEPVWVFLRGEERPDKLSALVGKRILIGPIGSGTAALATRLLAAGGVTAENATLINLELPKYVEALDTGDADAGFLVLAPEAKTIQRLFENPKNQLMTLTQASAYAQRYPFLHVEDLKEGVVDFAKDVPTTDTKILTTTAALVVREDIHPALASLLTQAAITVHSAPSVNAKGEADLFHRAGAFPIADDQEFPMSPDAERVYKSGAPFLQRYLPFWLATLLDRLTVMLLPAIGILLPAIRFAPTLYTWKIRRRLFAWYQKLMTVEGKIGSQPTPAEFDALLREIDHIDRAVNRLPIPVTFADQLYHLRGHIDAARLRLLTRRP